MRILEEKKSTNSYEFSLPCNKLRSLKQHTFIISQFLWVKDLGAAGWGSLLRISEACNQGGDNSLDLSEIQLKQDKLSGFIELLAEFLGAIGFMTVCFFKANNRDEG